MPEKDLGNVAGPLQGGSALHWGAEVRSSLTADPAIISKELAPQLPWEPDEQ